MALTALQRSQLIVLAALDWPVSQTQKVWRALKNGGLQWEHFRELSGGMKHKFDLTNYQLESAKKLFSEHTLYSFENWLETHEIRVIVWGDAAYPIRLKNLAHPPPVLWYQGDWPELNRTVAVIGTRHPSAYGNQASQLIVGQLVSHHCTIISGCMFGADITAQQQTLTAGGKAIGILGYGILERYPHSLTPAIAAFLKNGGTLLSVFPPWTKPRKWRFLARNQIVAALADAVVVTEALPKSGTHSTVTMAADLGKVAGVLPSPLMSPFAPGVSVLLEQGALLLHSAAQLIPEIPAWQTESFSDFPARANSEETQPTSRLIIALQAMPKTLTELSMLLAASPATLMVELTQLELQGSVIREGSLFRWR